MAEKPTDQEVLTDFADIFKQDVDYSQTIREMTWFRNILFFLGEQWIKWFFESGSFGPANFNPLEPTPVSNKIRDHVKSMKALILNKKYAARIWPNSETQKDKDAAKLGGMALKSFDNENCNEAEDVKELLADWMLLTGNSFARTYANMDNGKYVVNAKGDAVSKGDVVIECLPPFSIAVPDHGVLLRQKSKVGIKCLKEKEWVEDTYKVLLKASGSGDKIVEYEKQLMTMVADVSPWKGRTLDPGSIASLSNDKLVLYQEMEYRPTKKYPKGRYAVVVDGQVVENKTEMPINVGKDGEWFYTITDFKYNRTPGSFWATSAVDDLISPQKDINEIDKDLSANRQGLGRPFLLTTKDLVLKRKSLAGQHFLHIEIDGNTAGGIKPEVHHGTALPEQILSERNSKMVAMQDAGGDPKNILKGEKPSGNASGFMVDILRESAEMSHVPDIGRFYRSWNRAKKKQLIIAKDLITETRFIKIAGEGNRVLVKTFKGSNLHDNTDVRLELDSGVSTTRAGQNQFIMRLIEQKFFGDISQDPKMQYEILQRVGMSWIPAKNSVHEERADRENGMISAATDKEIHVDLSIIDPAIVDETGKPIPKPIPVLDGIFYSTMDPNLSEVVVLSFDPYFKYDNHQVHFDSHIRVILSPEFKEWSVTKQTVLINHADMHHFALEAQRQKDLSEAVQMQQLGGGGAPPKPSDRPEPSISGQPAGV
jgi:hypothetical protein